jgi:hypothetical protein
MKFGYCLECNSLVIPNGYRECKCGNLSGCYVNNTDAMFWIKDVMRANIVGVHSALIDYLFTKYNNDNVLVIDVIDHMVSEYLNRHQYMDTNNFRLIWVKPWEQGSKDGVRYYGDHKEFYYD